SVFSSAGSSCTPDNSPDDSLASRSLRNDLLVAADSVTNAMSSLVRELNSDYDFKGLYESPAWHSITDGTYSEDEGPLSHLHIRKASGDASLPNTQGGIESNKWRKSLVGNEQDDSIPRKESNTPDWEEAGMGWVNR
ncbi:hypothetical protein OTU49_003476, partial [Cherax quadricarinatus]